MGTWEGHISPGIAFYSFGIVFCFQFSREFLLEKVFHVSTRSESKPTTTIPTTIYGKVIHFIRGFPLDAFMKILYGVGAASAELFYPPGTNKLYLTFPDGKWAHLSEWQHFTMYISFAISGVIDVISYKMVRERIVVIEKAAVAMAFLITSLLLFYHRHGKTELEQEAHELLLYATLVMVVLVTMEMWLPCDRRLLWGHTLAVMIMGSWLFHMAFILFPFNHQPWHNNDPMNEMVLPMFFCWHILFNSAVAGSIFLSQYFWFKSKYANKNYSEMNRLSLLGDDVDDDDETIFRSGYSA